MKIAGWGLLILSFVATAAATTFVPRDVQCPVCEVRFEALVVASTNSFGGRDPDFCPHPRGTPTIPYGVWTCPGCGYTSDEDGFSAPVAEDFRRRVREELKPPIELAASMSQHQIPGWVKYELRATLRSWQGADERELATLHLLAAWSERLQAGRHVAAPGRDEALRDPIARVQELVHRTFRDLREEGSSPYEVDLAIAGRLVAVEPGADPTEAALRQLLAARFRRERGELVAAEADLQALAARPELRPSILESVRALEGSIEIERRFLARAVEGLAGAIADSPAEERDARRVQVAEILRSLGRGEEALARYRAVLEEGQPPPWLVEQIERSLERMGAEYRPSPERLEALRRRRVETLIADLRRPETAGDAARELVALGDPGARDAALEVLAGGPDECRRAAIEVLGGLPDPDGKALGALVDRLGKEADEQVRVAIVIALEGRDEPAATEALARRLEEDASDRVRSVTLRALVRRLDPSLAPRFRSLAASPTAGQADRNEAIRALGLLGDAEALPVLLDLYESSPRASALALDRIANTAFWPHIPLTSPPEGSVDAFRAWWEEHRDEGREAWVRDGFRAAGRDLGEIDASDVPALIEALEDERQAIRFNAWTILRSLTGQSFGRDVLFQDGGHGADRTIWREDVVPAWREWWRDQKR